MALNLITLFDYCTGNLSQKFPLQVGYPQITSHAFPNSIGSIPPKEFGKQSPSMQSKFNS